MSSSTVIIVTNEKNTPNAERKCQTSWESKKSTTMQLLLPFLDSAGVFCQFVKPCPKK
jgi:hypothetical protein